MEPIFRQAREQALERYSRNVQNGQTSHQSAAILEAAAQTILHGGTVYVFPSEAVPDLPGIPAAILRYP